MALDEIYQLTLKQLWGVGGEPMLNHFFYRSVSAGVAALDLIEGFRDTGGMLELINAIQSNWVQNHSLRVINLGDLGDFGEDEIVGTGANGGVQVLPPHSAINYTLKLDTRAVRNGSKRFSGIGEEFQEHGIINSAPYLAVMNDLKTGLGAVITYEDVTFTPIVVKRIHVVAAGPPPEDYYRLPETDGELVYGSVTAVLVNTKVSHQVSRGNGR